MLVRVDAAAQDEEAAAPEVGHLLAGERALGGRRELGGGLRRSVCTQLQVIDEEPHASRAAAAARHGFAGAGSLRLPTPFP